MAFYFGDGGRKRKTEERSRYFGAFNIEGSLAKLEALNLKGQDTRNW